VLGTPARGCGCFSSDGRGLATSGLDRSLKIWSVVGDSLCPDEPLTLSVHTAAAYPVARNPEGRQLATASRDGTSRVYVMNLDDLIQLAHSR
jgi:WD40 repeat protein